MKIQRTYLQEFNIHFYLLTYYCVTTIATVFGSEINLYVHSYIVQTKQYFYCLVTDKYINTPHLNKCLHRKNLEELIIYYITYKLYLYI
jgi:hypothetical protein